MVARSVEQIFRSLNDAGARYLVAGGLAVVAHGFVRFTNDVDIVLDLAESNCRAALGALARLGYRPLVPVSLGEFADAAKRRAWARDKGARVFQLFSDAHPATRIDLFLEAPFDFDEVYSRRSRQTVEPDLEVPFVGLEDLIDMKRRAGRPQDLADADKLEQLRGQ